MRLFCIGRNYSEHAKELGNDLPTEPVVFMKPAESLVPRGQPIRFPRHGKQLQHELEVVVQIGKSSVPKSKQEARAMISAIALGLDLTLRDVQNTLKAKGLPWEIAKSFEHSAAISNFTPYNEAVDLSEIEFQCLVNNELRQSGQTKNMIFSIEDLICYLSQIWQLQPGDLIFTGTPAGVGDLKPGDSITAISRQLGSCKWLIE